MVLIFRSNFVCMCMCHCVNIYIVYVGTARNMTKPIDMCMRNSVESNYVGENLLDATGQNITLIKTFFRYVIRRACKRCTQTYKEFKKLLQCIHFSILYTDQGFTSKPIWNTKELSYRTEVPAMCFHPAPQNLWKKITEQKFSELVHRTYAKKHD